MDKKNEGVVETYEEDLVKHEGRLTRFVACNAPMMTRHELVCYYEKIQSIYKKLGNTKKVTEFQKLLNQAKDTKAYLAIIEDRYEAICEHFSNEKKIINIVHQNLIDAYIELGYTDKVEYYRARLNEWLDANNEV